MERPLGAHEAVAVLRQRLNPAVPGHVEQGPVERAVEVPLATLAELTPHEEQLLARVRPGEREVGAQPGELAPRIAGKAREQRTLAVHDLVVREREHEVLGERVHHAEGHLVVMPPPVHRVLGHVVERVVHPPHVPLEAEAESAVEGGTRDRRPGRALLGDREGAGKTTVDGLVHAPQEGDRFEVLAATELVGDPLAVLARVVEVEHRRDRIHAEPVDVVAVEPEERARNEEVADLAAPEVVDRGVPIGMEAEPGVLMLVECGAVEAREPVRVHGEVCRDPVDDHADPFHMTAIDEARERGRLAEARRRREHPHRLVAPRLVERVLVHRHELQMREAHRLHVRHESVGEFVVGEPLALVPTLPRAEMDLVRGHGCAAHLRGGA